MKDKYTLKINNKQKNRAEITMYGDISRYDVSAKNVSELLKDLDEKTNEIDLRLFSGGGDVFEGIAIYNILRRSGKNITVHIDGLAASIASVIMLAGDEVIMGEGSQVMIHRPWAVAAGNSSEFLELIDRLDQVENEITKIYENRTGLSRSELSNMMSAETWFNDDEAVEFGFANKKVENKVSVNIAASIKDCEWIRRKELANSSEEFKNTIKETIKKYNDVLARK